jgi:hypothetical protein
MSDKERHAPLSSAGWLAFGVLIGFLAVAIWYGIYTWDALGDVHMSVFGWFALIAGSVITIGVGGGLMALIFYSSRNDFDR